MAPIARSGPVAWFFAALTASTAPARAEEATPSAAVDVALVLAVDVSGSVDNDRFELQRRGYAAAFTSRDVLDAIAAGENHAIAVTLVEWSGANHQRQVVGWTLVHDATSAQAFGSAIGEAPRVFSDWTSISGALDFAVGLLDDPGFVGARRVIDISGDGVNNNGREASLSRDEALHLGIVINGLPILTEYPALDAYYRDNVIGGPNAFVVAVTDFSVFGDAVLGKLVREIAGVDGPRLTIAADR
ncbi:MAG TPA: DUF1194 domain-containing protein [Stellaceae bacterium]|nr:DUF1194 domain-containing protein [Stellaceae bacterium]